uniref:Secreted protein n=1 Tax=Ixodes ricinus TaxID=34613 RepID=A0A6B0UPG4_IXORI
MCTSAWLWCPVRVSDGCVHCVLKCGALTFVRRRCRSVAPSFAAIPKAAQWQRWARQMPVLLRVAFGYDGPRKIRQTGIGMPLRWRLLRSLPLLAELLWPFAGIAGAGCMARRPPRPRLCPFWDHF